jgi:CRP-like cAMP-binding protein
MSEDAMANAPQRMFDRQFFSAGVVIFNEGDPAKYAYVVQTGKVEISHESEGRKIVLNEIGPQGIFGEMALIDGHARSATATALEDTTCILIREQEMMSRLERSDPFVRGLVRILVRNVRSTNRLLR